MDRLRSLIYSITATVLSGTALVFVLVAGWVTGTAIIAALATGALVAVPVSGVITRALMEEKPHGPDGKRPRRSSPGTGGEDHS